jgi:hypothetical protein
MPISHALHRMIASLSTLVLILLALQPACAHAGMIAATAFFQYGNSSFTGGFVPTPIFSDTSLVGSVSAAYDSGFQASGSLEYHVVAASSQGYGIFAASASAYMKRLSPFGFEYFQSFATGTFKETLTIPAPLGVANGSTGNLMLGWDITGSRVQDPDSIAGSNAQLYISARTSAPLPGYSSFVIGIDGNGHHQLLSPLQFIFGTPFLLTIDSHAFAGTGYDYRFTPAPSQFTGYAAASYSNTAILSAALVSDAAGTLYPDAAINTASGRAFLVSTAVPEPNSLVLLLAGAGLLMVSRRARRALIPCRNQSSSAA